MLTTNDRARGYLRRVLKLYDWLQGLVSDSLLEGLASLVEQHSGAGCLPVIEMPQAVLADRVHSRDANETKIRRTAIFGNLDCRQMTGLKKHAAIQVERTIVDD